ncbi:MAG: hypothetical protein DRI61_02060 [Chloroflexi bacterium]|nr:MAG: hypothetical protein DRI61_02060 [Chloroflexota bacterium]
MKRMACVLTVGDINIDIVALLDQYPPKGGDALAKRGELHIGGSAANTALVLARFGLEVSLLGRVGSGILADYALQGLRKAGVELSLVQRDPEVPIGVMFIAVTPDGERTMFGFRGANTRLKPVRLGEGELGKLRWVHISGYALLEEPQRTAALRILETARQKGITVSLDVGMCTAIHAREEVRKLLPQVDVLFPNLEEARLLSQKEEADEALKALVERGVKLIALKLGEKGCMIGDGEKAFTVPAFAIDAVDTTGAGDSFNAGFILGQLWGLNLPESALLGNALGGLACTVVGAGESLPTPQKVVALLQGALASPTWEPWKGGLNHLLEILKGGTKR